MERGHSASDSTQGTSSRRCHRPTDTSFSCQPPQPASSATMDDVRVLPRLDYPATDTLFPEAARSRSNTRQSCMAQRNDDECEFDQSLVHALNQHFPSLDASKAQPGVCGPLSNAPTVDLAMDHSAPDDEDDVLLMDKDDDDDEFLRQVQIQVTQAAAVVANPAKHRSKHGRKNSHLRTHPHVNAATPPPVHEQPLHRPAKRITATHFHANTGLSVTQPCELPTILSPAATTDPTNTTTSNDDTAPVALPPLPPVTPPRSSHGDVDPTTLLSWGEMPDSMEVVDEDALVPGNLHATPETGQEHWPPLHQHHDGDASPSRTTSEVKVQAWLRQKQRLHQKRHQQHTALVVVDKAKRQADSDSQYRLWLAQKKKQRKREKAAATAKLVRQQNERLRRLQVQAVEIQTIQAHTKARRHASQKPKKARPPRRTRDAPTRCDASVGAAPFMKHEREVATTMQRLDDVERVLVQIAARALRIP
ncbi:hypothetical protein H310_07454 [Aphanomyces invadans]|uniref:Uncharacterized protein n=1 Tax=Aphanomyces invadans TaxID=157072 RepID=A0A024U191_9STRA|nr:hypothetical protein H310_07454 [Aphanomyces invadans]ETW00014.1 hypothetical protein H310_07454 [Aphanomyces invadans]|eukprot:XP_008871039.1 hypothetical protein H310_07454 [Aphanomyces invadans]